MITINGMPAVIAEKLTLGRVRLKSEDGSVSQVYSANQLSVALSQRGGRLYTADQLPPTQRDIRAGFTQPKPINQLAAKLGL